MSYVVSPPNELASTIGARPWRFVRSAVVSDVVAVPVRESTITLVMRNESGAFVAAGTEVRWAWFDALSLTPATIGAAGALTINAQTALPAAGAGWLLVTTSDGTPGEQSRAHAAPTIAP